MGLIDLAEQGLPVTEKSRDRVEIPVELPKLKLNEAPEALTWKVLVLPPRVPEQTRGGIVLARQSVSVMHAMNRVGCVISIGELAFSEKRGFPKDYMPIEVGDWVAYSENAGFDMWAADEDGNLVKVKILSESDFGAKIEKPDSLMVVL